MLAGRAIARPAAMTAPEKSASFQRPANLLFIRLNFLLLLPLVLDLPLLRAEEPVQGNGGGPGLVVAAERGACHGVVVLGERAVGELVEGGRPEPRCYGSLAVAAQ